ncbi:MAG TPA: PAS domain S-box protein [Candidatus Kapabacteria bacterium]|nr:PAS domain S-box protein [Candidatus Kapabacteria bacterium]HPO61942.1 PAS domain S-box protein [Candidatus Kapabacteria bacterium]
MEEINFRKLLDNAPFGYAYHKIIVDENEEAIDYIFLEINSAFTQLTGIGSDIINKRITEVVPSIVNDKFNWIKYYGEIALSGGLKEFEQYSTPLNRWYKVQVYSKEKYYFVTIFIDITKEKTNLEELEEFFSVNLDLLCIADVEGNFIKTNRAWEDILGYKTEELNKRKFLEFVHPDDIPATLKAMETLSHQEKVINFVNRYRCQDGSYRYIEWRSHPKGNLIYAAARDITERNEIIEALKHSEEKYKILVENANDIIYSLTLNGDFIYVSPVWKKLLGHEPNELEGKSFSEFVHPDDIPTCFEFLQKIIESKSNQAGIEYRVLHKDGKWRYHKTNGAPLLTPDGKVSYFIGVARDITENKKTEEELKANEQQFVRVIEHLPISLSIITIDGTPVYLNSKFIELFEIETDDYQKNISVSELWTEPNDRLIWLDELQKNGIIKDYEMKLQSLKGKQLWAIGSGILINYKNQNCVLSTHIDISRRKIAEEELATERNQLLSIFDSIDELIYVSDTDTFEIVFANKKLRNLFGDDVIGKECYNVMQGKDGKCPFCNSERIKAIYPETYKWEYTNHLNKTFIVYNRMIRWTDGRLLRFEIAYDISERKKAEQTLYESEEKLRAIYNSANIGILIVNKEGHFIMVNDWISDLLKYSNDELLNKTIIDVTYLEDIEVSKTYFNKVLKGEIENYKIDKRFLRSDNGTVWCNLSVAPIKDVEHNIIYIVGMVIDITEQKYAEEELKKYAAELIKINEELVISKELIEASLEQKNALIEELNDIKNRLEITNSEKDKFFSIIAHDLRSPFQGFLGLTKLMAEDLDNMSMKDMRELSNDMQNSANNLFKLLDNLLQWSRLQRGAMDFKVDSINIHQIVQQNINISLETAKQKNIKLINSVPAEIYAVADYQMINTVVRNLLSNAIKFTNKNGNILIGANSTPEKIVCVFVKDDGIGMDKQILSDLFKIDKKVTRPGTSGETSTGLGLLLCKDFIEKNNGSIWVESEVDKGSTFFFTLPQNVTENVDLSIFGNFRTPDHS